MPGLGARFEYLCLLRFNMSDRSMSDGRGIVIRSTSTLILWETVRDPLIDSSITMAGSFTTQGLDLEALSVVQVRAYHFGFI